jgi:hypothetical protein
MVMALRSTFHPDAARDVTVTYELRLGPIVLSAHIERGELEVVEGAAERPDLVIETGPAIKALMAREITPDDAVAAGSVAVTGDPELLATFADIFGIP